MGLVEKTVFISYRRQNLPWALAIYQNLTSNGFDVFFDYLSIKSGDFEQVILENIKAKAHFLVVLTPSALERCNQPGDWLRREIEVALDERRNIVPIMLEGFNFGNKDITEALTGKLAALKSYNGLPVPAEYFFEAMERLRKQYLNMKLSDIHLHPLSNKVKETNEIQKIVTDKSPQVKTEQLSAQQWLERGLVFDKEKNFDEAIRCYTEAINLSPDFAYAYNNRGGSRRSKGDLDGATQDIEIAIRLNPEEADAYYNRGITRHDESDLDGALQDFDTAIRLNPEDADFYFYRGIAYIGRNNLDSAFQDFNKVIQLDPSNAQAYNNRGNILSAKNDLDGAIKDYDKAILLKHDFVEAYNNRGNTYSSLDNLDRAIIDFNEVCRLKPDFPGLYNRLGTVYSIKGDNIHALLNFQKACEFEPEKGSIRSSLIRVLKGLGLSEEAKTQEKIARNFIQKEDEYNQACFEVICGNFDQGLELLKISFEKQQVDKEWAKEDLDLESIRDDPRFKVIIGE